MGSLTVHFRGICVHFPHHFLKATPHRVVLPDARALRFGTVEMPERHRRDYALPPHFAVLLARDAPPHMPGTIRFGLIEEGIRLYVENSIPGVQYGPHFPFVPCISEFAGAIPSSPEVVQEGAALCYFDVSGGFVDAEPQAGSTSPDPPLIGVQITIETPAGCPPILLASRLADPHSVPIPVALPEGDDVELIVGNVDSLHGEGGADGVDFLLNFLVLERGIPDRVIMPLPKPGRKSFLDLLVDAIVALRDISAPNQVALPSYEQILTSSTLSCSNTQFP